MQPPHLCPPYPTGSLLLKGAPRWAPPAVSGAGHRLQPASPGSPSCLNSPLLRDRMLHRPPLSMHMDCRAGFTPARRRMCRFRPRRTKEGGPRTTRRR
jgi:hypothetical protein